MKIPCSSCNQRLEIPEELAGQTIECPTCNATLAVPALETPPPAVPQVQESSPQAETKPVEPVAEAAKPETPTAKVPDTIYRAAQAGNIEAVKQHLAAGADVNVKDKVGGTPLHRAAYKGHKEIVELLIDNGADVNAERHETVKVTPIQEAAFGASETTYKTYLEIMSILIAAGADVNAHGSGNTVLEEVIKLPELVELLIANGADVNTRGIRGRTPLDRAINKKSPETADLLRKHGGKTGAELKAEGK